MLPELAAEFFGTLILILFGNGVVAMVVLFGHGAPGEIVNGGYTNITIAWGLAVTMGVYVAGRISGGHINPAVTLAVAVFRGFPWKKVIPYWIAQVAGAFVAAAIVYWNYRPQFHVADPGLDHTTGVFTTFPAFPQMLSAGLLDRTIGTALLVFMILAITDERNQPPGANLIPVLIGAIVVFQSRARSSAGSSARLSMMRGAQIPAGEEGNQTHYIRSRIAFSVALGLIAKAHSASSGR